MADDTVEQFEEGSAFYRDHQATWTGFLKWGARATVLAAILVFIVFAISAWG